MATTHAHSATPATSTNDGALTPEVRRRLKSAVLDLRHLIEDDFRRQLVAVAVAEEGVKPLAAGRALSDEQRRVRDTAVAILKREVAGGASQTEAYATLLRESVFTFLNRAIGLRCLEARGLLLVDGQTETAITQQEELGGVPSLYWRVRNSPGSPAQPREIWRETYRRACAAVSRDIRVLFDPQAEYAALFPLLPATQRVIEALNDPMIPAAAYAEDAVLGWVYQYFQSEEKDRIFAAVRTQKKKIGGADIIPVTQLYTEQYMVDFLLQNSLGRAWMEMYPDSPAKSAWPYYVEPATPHSRPRKPLRDWTILDPCVGSGHFLVVAFDLLAQLYAEERRLGEAGVIPLEETVAPADVPLAILERNLYGIDIDRRATQIATLALYLKARQAGLARSPRVNIVAADASYLQGEAWERFLAGFQREPSVGRVLAAMAGYLKDIRELGSLLRPEDELKRLIAEEHQRWLDAGRPEQAGLFPEYSAPRQEKLAFEHIAADDETFWRQLSYRAESAIQGFYDSARASGDLDEQIVAGEAQRGFAFLELCQRRYDVVCTNPPYMNSKSMGKTLKDFVAKNYEAGKRDIYAAFILRCREWAATDGYAAMVTQQSWMFLSSYENLRSVPDKNLTKAKARMFTGLLRETNLELLAHLGAGAFAEISGEVVSIVLFTLRLTPAVNGHKLAAFRLVGARDSKHKERALQRAIHDQVHGDVYSVRTADLSSVPGSPLVYWLPHQCLELLTDSHRAVDVLDIVAGASTGDNERFLRLHWEVALDPIGWAPYAKGGGYGRWAGQVLDVGQWSAIKTHIQVSGSGAIRNERFFFRAGGTYTENAGRSLGARLVPDRTFFDAKGNGIFPRDHNTIDIFSSLAVLNSHTATYLLRAIVPTMDFDESYVRLLPWPKIDYTISRIGYFAVSLKLSSLSACLTERNFQAIQLGAGASDSVYALLHACEGANDRRIVHNFRLDSTSISAIVNETGTPAGWHPLVAAYDALPELPADLPPVPQELVDYLASHQRVALAPDQLARLKARLRALYVAGPGAKVVEETEDAAGKNGNGESNGEDDDEEGAVALGARIPIPAETFLEELSQKLEVHPISVYWLLEEMRRDEGLVCPPEMKRQMEDYASVTLLRELGFRWPEQDAWEAERGPILDPALVVPDGILPLVECGVGAAAARQLRLRLERDFGEEGAAESEAEFRKWVGRPLDDWLRRDFFKRHIQQFKQRPIAWHFVSPQKTFEAFVLYHKLCDESNGVETLRALRTQYAGGLITRLRAEQDRARSARDEREVTRLQLAIEDVEEFRDRLERIERGDDGDLKARIRCRWKGDEAKVGRPGPYAPDINDGVKVNVRPFQDLALLAAPVIKKWD